MNGPGHYAEAERLAERSYHFTYGDGADAAVGHALAALAQVHATLALTETQAPIYYITNGARCAHADVP